MADRLKYERDDLTRRLAALPEARDSKGRFLPGNPGGPGNPQAHNVATWRKALAEAVSADDVTEVAQKLLDAAKAGEPWAIHELLDRCLGKPHVQVELQADDGIAGAHPLTEAEQEEARRIAMALTESGAVNLPVPMQEVIIAEMQRRALPPNPPLLAPPGQVGQ